jgi:hypothetical protein
MVEVDRMDKYRQKQRGRSVQKVRRKEQHHGIWTWNFHNGIKNGMVIIRVSYTQIERNSNVPSSDHHTPNL